MEAWAEVQGWQDNDVRLLIPYLDAKAGPPKGLWCLQTSSKKKLLGAKGIATRSKDTTRGAPGVLTSSKKLLVTRASLLVTRSY